jgi:site-specific DNA recombinase
MKAGLYVRVSTDAQVEKWSLPAQRRALVEFAERHGWKYEVYEDAGISGETLDARPAVLRLLDDARARRIQVAVAVEMERFSRSESLFDWLVIKKAFREGHVRFGTPQQLYDPADSEDDFLTDLFGALSKREKRKILERTRRGRLEAARKGRFVGTRIPIGYRLAAPGVLEVDEQGGRIVRLIFDLALRGRSTRAIARELWRRGVPSPRGAQSWQHSEVARVLRNPVYIGQMQFNRTRVVRADARRRLIRMPEQDWVIIGAPRLVTDDEFRRVEAQLRKNQLFSPRRRKTTYLVSGLVRCGVCGSAMSGSGSGGRAYYRCNRTADPQPGEERCRGQYVRADRLDEAVWAQVVAAVRRPETILEAARRYQESHISQRDQLLLRLDAVQAALQEIPEARGRVQRLYRDGRATLDEANAQLDELAQRQRALLEERGTLEARLSMQTAEEAETDRLERLVATVSHKLDHLPAAKQIEVIRAFVRRVTVQPGPTIEVHALVPLPASATERPRYVGTLWAQAISSR